MTADVGDGASDGSPLVRRRHDGNRNLVVTVAEAVATATGVDVMELDTPLHDVIDTETMEAVLDRDAEHTRHVSFVYHGFRVRIDSDGWVRVHSLDVD